MSVEKLAARLSKISESQTLAMARKSRELQALGKDIISLSIGEPDYKGALKARSVSRLTHLCEIVDEFGVTFTNR